MSHTTASLAVRESLSVAGHELESALALFAHRVHEALILSTCHRTEVYAVVDEKGDTATLRDFLAERSGLSPAALFGASYMHEDERAARHLLRVASGLDSMVLGEDQIQAQVKRAITLARRAQSLGPTLDRLGSAALACGKRVRTFTGIGRHAVSLESLAMRAAADRMGPLAEREVVIIGAGESAALVARQLRKAGASRVTVVSRSSERSQAIATTLGATARSLADLADVLCVADVVFACSSAPHPVLTADFIAHRSAQRVSAHAVLLCVDLGMPRNVDPAVEKISGVSVVTLDELSTLAIAHREARRAHIPAAEAIVDAELRRFLAWLNARAAAAAVSAIDAQSNAVAENELARALSRLPSLEPREREIVAEMAYRIARKLAHGRIQPLKTPPESERPRLG